MRVSLKLGEKKINRNKRKRIEKSLSSLRFRVFLDFFKCRFLYIFRTCWSSEKCSRTIERLKAWQSNDFVKFRAAIYNRLDTRWKWFIWLGIVRYGEILLWNVCSFRRCRRIFWILLKWLKRKILFWGFGGQSAF